MTPYLHFVSELARVRQGRQFPQDAAFSRATVRSERLTTTGIKWYEPEFHRQLDPTAVRVSIAADEQKIVNLRADR